VTDDKTPALEQLQLMLNRHVTYELNMLIRTHGLLIGIGLEPAVGNALIESFCVHARNLDEFFQSTGNWPDSLKASSFTTDYKPGPSLPKALKTRMNQQITHLSWGRAHDPNKLVNATERHQMFLMLVAEAVHFGEHLKPEFRGWKYRINLDQALDPPPSK
jgi:hypothetical protein